MDDMRPFAPIILVRRPRRTYRRMKITVTNNEASALTNFETGINVWAEQTDRAIRSLCDAAMRITGPDGDLPFWTVSGFRNNRFIWVKIPYIAASGTYALELWYDGYTGQKWTGENVFWFFDDFPGNAVDATKWGSVIMYEGSGAGTWSVANSCLSVATNGGSECRLVHTNYVPASANDYEVRTRHKVTARNGVPDYGILVNYQNTNQFYMANHCHWEADNTCGLGKRNTAYTNLATGLSYPQLEIWQDAWARRIGSASLSMAVAHYPSISSADNAYNQGQVGINYDDVFGGTITFLTDWLFVKKAVTNEPSITIGADEPITRRW